jgi:hypothetical protein
MIVVRPTGGDDGDVYERRLARSPWGGAGTVDLGEDGVVRRDGQLLAERHNGHNGSDHGTLAASAGRSTTGWPIARLGGPRPPTMAVPIPNASEARDSGRGLRSEPWVECLLTVTPTRGCVANER